MKPLQPVIAFLISVGLPKDKRAPASPPRKPGMSSVTARRRTGCTPAAKAASKFCSTAHSRSPPQRPIREERREGNDEPGKLDKDRTPGQIDTERMPGQNWPGPRKGLDFPESDRGPPAQPGGTLSRRNRGKEVSDEPHS